MASLGEVDKTETGCIIRWKIINFFSLKDTCYCSPNFSFIKYRFYFRLYPNGNTCDKSHTSDLISVYLSRPYYSKPFFHPPIKITLTLSLETQDGQKVSTAHKECVFTIHDHSFGFPNFATRSELKEKKSELMPSDTLTIVCSMKCSESTEDAIEKIAPVSPELPQWSKFLQDFKQLYLNQEESDVTIRVKEQEFRAHKAILIARSPVFASTFRNKMKEKETGVIDIVDCDPPVFSEFLRFLYCQEIDNLSSENVVMIFTVADKYDVTDLKTKCLEFMKTNLNKDTFFDTITLALKHSERELLKLTTDFFSENAQDIIMTVEWQSFIRENPIQGNELFIKFMASHKFIKK